MDHTLCKGGHEKNVFLKKFCNLYENLFLLSYLQYIQERKMTQISIALEYGSAQSRQTDKEALHSVIGSHTMVVADIAQPIAIFICSLQLLC